MNYYYADYQCVMVIFLLPKTSPEIHIADASWSLYSNPKQNVKNKRQHAKSRAKIWKCQKKCVSLHRK